MRKYTICGCFRSLTTPVANMLNMHPDIVSFNELWYYRSDNQFNSKMQNIIRNNLDPFGPQSRDKCVEFRDKVRQKYGSKHMSKDDIVKIAIDVFGKQNVSCLIDKLPEYVYHISNIKTQYNTKFIQMIRDPREVIEAQIRRYELCKQHRYKPGSWQQPTPKACVDFKLSWLNMTNEWEKNKKLLKPDEYFILNCNEIFEDSDTTATKLAQFLEVDPIPIIKEFKRFNPEKQHLWRKRFPNLTNQLPKSWIKRMDEYGIKI